MGNSPPSTFQSGNSPPNSFKLDTCLSCSSKERRQAVPFSSNPRWWCRPWCPSNRCFRDRSDSEAASCSSFSTASRLGEKSSQSLSDRRYSPALCIMVSSLFIMTNLRGMQLCSTEWQWEISSANILSYTFLTPREYLTSGLKKCLVELTPCCQSGDLLHQSNFI